MTTEEPIEEPIEDDMLVQEKFRRTQKQVIKENLYSLTYFDVNPDPKTLHTKIHATNKQTAIAKLLKRYDDFQIDDIKLIRGTETNSGTAEFDTEQEFIPAFNGAGMSEKVGHTWQ